MTVLWIVLMLIVLLIAVVLLRAVLLKPTAAQTAKVQLDESPRAEKYGKQLSKLVQKETLNTH